MGSNASNEDVEPERRHDGGDATEQEGDENPDLLLRIHLKFHHNWDGDSKNDNVRHQVIDAIRNVHTFAGKVGLFVGQPHIEVGLNWRVNEDIQLSGDGLEHYNGLHC